MLIATYIKLLVAMNPKFVAICMVNLAIRQLQPIPKNKKKFGKYSLVTLSFLSRLPPKLFAVNILNFIGVWGIHRDFRT